MPYSDPATETAKLFREAELRAESLVAVIRMSVALGLTVVFLVAVSSTNARDVDADVLNRQWFYASVTVGCYFVLGALSWILVRLGAFRLWMVWPTATGDCLFILTNLWLALRNTGLGAEYVFLFPPIWLVPLVLAFGALRFDPWIQGYIACVMMVGVMGLELIDPGAAREADIATVNLFFSMPPNAMRLAMLGLASAVLVLASIRVRRILLRSLTENLRSTNLTRYLPSQLAPRLAEGGLGELREGRRQDMAILFVDMRGFTRLSEAMPPHEVSALITDYRARITAAAKVSGGMIDKFMGDAALIVFEDETSPQTAARASLSCAERILWDIADWSAEREQENKPAVRAGVGLHWGSVFCGVVGDTDRLEYSVFGDAVNTTARLEEMTKSQGVALIASRDLLDVAGLSRAPQGWLALPDTNLRGRSGVLPILGKVGPFPVQT